MSYRIFTNPPPRIQAGNPAVGEYTGIAKHIRGFSGKQYMRWGSRRKESLPIFTVWPHMTMEWALRLLILNLCLAHQCQRISIGISELEEFAFKRLMSVFHVRG